MHSSRMRTGRSLTACRGGAEGGGCARGEVPEGVCQRGGGFARGGCAGGCPRGGVCARGGSGPMGVVSQHALRQTPPPLTE